MLDELDAVIIVALVLAAGDSRIRQVSDLDFSSQVSYICLKFYQTLMSWHKLAICEVNSGHGYLLSIGAEVVESPE